MNSFNEDLKKLFDSFESEKILVILKENLIFMVSDDYNFNEEYKENSKILYFEKLRNYIDLLNKSMDKQIKISNLKLNELYKVSEYQEEKSILETLEWSTEYIRNKYIERGLTDDIITRYDIKDEIRLDIEKINTFLDSSKIS